MHNFKELKVWQKGMKIAEKTYEMTSLLPFEEKFGLISQMRRSAISIPSNIAEGSGRNSNGEFKQFLGMANGSANELLTQILLSERLKLIEGNKTKLLLNEIKEVQKMNYMLIRKYS